MSDSLPSRGSRLLVAGLGYAGLPLAVRAVEAGFTVRGVDPAEQRVKRLATGDSCFEDIPSARLAAALETGRLSLGTDYRDEDLFDVCVITVPTPLREDGEPDLGCVESAGRSVGGLLRAGGLVILESTTYPGTTEELLRPLLEDTAGLRAGRDFLLGYSPERIDPGNPEWHLENTPKVVSGIDATSLRAVEAFFGRLVDRTVPVSSTRTAELTKLLENTFRHVNVALVNELAMLARPLGVDIREAVEAAATKPYGFMAFRPGPGAGGHGLPVDPSYLSFEVRRGLRRDVRFVALANEVNEVNEEMPAYVVGRLADALAARGVALAGARVLLLGLACERDSGDVRESPALAVAELLHTAGALVRAVEPHADPATLPAGLLCVPLTARELSEADAVVLLTDHSDTDYALVERWSRYVLDTRARCAGEVVEHL